jgi:hypothetical protein
MILGINWVRLSFKSESGAGISAPGIANLEAFSKRRDMRVLQALIREPIMIKLMTTKITVPRRIVKYVGSVKIEGRIVGYFESQGYGRAEEGVQHFIDGGVGEG